MRFLMLRRTKGRLGTWDSKNDEKRRHAQINKNQPMETQNDEKPRCPDRQERANGGSE